ncbi:putative F-box domain, leucine-rich repeat domain superfamily, F-box-like domain superfamily [Helianthus annuus]|nr:putative F-box domain, leucine-rich repeat domain superfamily, F-box-like domain superfamily [Helianthus annuus]
MELITDKASNFAPQDVISKMPDNVVTHILDRLPLQDAVRTSILSRNWRLKWTTLSQLVFDKNFFEYLLKTKSENNYEKIISRILLNLRGAITKFVLYIEEQSYAILDDEDVNHWMLFLSSKGVKDISLCKENGPRLWLPTHLFSCLELKHLKLNYCDFDPPSSFNGFPNLLSLELHIVRFESGKFVEFFTQCPVLETLTMGFSIASNVKLAEIAKLANLKKLSFCFGNLDKRLIISSGVVFELVGSLPKLEELEMEFLWCEFIKDDAKKRCPTTFPCLKTLDISTMDLENGGMLSCAFEIIRSSPNLQTLKIIPSFGDEGIPTPSVCSLEDYKTTRLLQLRSVEFTHSCTENELRLIEYLLACSPFLEKIVIHPFCALQPDDELRFATELLKLHRASPVVDIDLN